MATGIVIARFQVCDLTEGHKALIARAWGENDRIVFMLGVSPVKGDSDDPLDFETRRGMLLTEFPNAIILPLPGHASNAVWSQQLDARIREAVPFDTIKLYCGRLGFKDKYSGKFEVVEIDAVDCESGTEQRARLANAVENNADFRHGIIYGLENRYPQTIPTVDIAVFRKDNLVPEVLMGQKKDVPGLRFPGGFVDFSDQSYEEAASRELTEETGYLPKKIPTYVTSRFIDDKRYNGRRASRILTTLYTIKLQDCSKANPIDDELVNLQWIRLDLGDAYPNYEKQIDPIHLPLFQSLKTHYKVK